jgi:hypothetical protein
VNWCFDRRFSWTVQRLESEIQFERELDDPTIAGGENSSKCGRFPPDIRWTKIRMIECIEELGSELEEAILIHVDVLRNREIEVCQAWASHDANAGLLLRSPDFAVVVIVTMTLGIGANTAIFSLVHGVILRPFSYPKPDQLMYLTTQFPTLGFLQFWVSPPEYIEFQEINRSFSDVGAYTTGEVNLRAGDRPLRVRSANVDEHLVEPPASP